MKSIKLVFTLLIGTIILNGCLKGDDTPQEPYATLFVINAYTPLSSASFYIDGNPLRAFQYKGGDVFRLALGNRKLSATANNNADIADVTFTTEEYTIYTSYLFGSDESPQLLVSEDKGLQDLGSDKAAIRFIHIAEGLDEEVDFYIGDEIIPDLSNRLQETEMSLIQHERFIAVDNGTVDIFIKDKEGNVLASLEGSRSLPLQAGAYYSLNLIGTYVEDEDDEEENETPLEIFVVPMS